MTKRFTKASFKKFIKENQNELFVKVESSFSGMTDAVESVDSPFTLVNPNEINLNNEHTLGIKGLWLVGDSRDYFESYDQNGFHGYSVWNSCGESIICIRRAQ